MPKRLEGLQAQLENYNKQTEAARTELAQPFPQEAELAAKEQRLALLNSDLNIDGDSDMDVLNDTESRDESGEKQARRNDVSDDYDEPDECDEPLPRTGTYGKAAPTFMDSIRSLGEKKRGNPQPCSKAADMEI